MSVFLYKEETYKIIGAAMKVHSTLGCGFTEKVYQDALEVELQKQGIPYLREPRLHVSYEGIILATTFEPDFVCYEKIILELKAVRDIEDMHRAQVMNYAKVGGFKVALLLNFGDVLLQHERFANFEDKEVSSVSSF